MIAVLEGIRICRKGFPNRMYHVDFVQRYALLAPEEAKSVKDLSKDAMPAADKMLKKLVKQGKLNDEQFRLGTTKVRFLAFALSMKDWFRSSSRPEWWRTWRTYGTLDSRFC